MVKSNGDRWAVLIGINGYHESLGRLKYSVNDCRRLAEVLTSGDDAFPADHVLVLADDEDAERKPTYANIHSWLASWLAQPDEDDTALVFFAGHGREMDGKCYLVPGDATLQTIHVTGIPVPYVQELLNRCKARQKVLILDACHSGAGRDVSTMVAPMMETLSAGKGIYTITSCDVDELSHEWDEKQQGVFSYYFAEALSGSCPPDAHGRVTADAVYDWVYQRVRHWASGSRCSQNPKRVSNASGAILLRQADPDWKALARSLQAKLDTSEAAAARLREELDQARERESLLVELRRSARERMVSGGVPRTKADQKRLLNDLISSGKLSPATQDEMLVIIADEAARASAVQDAHGEARKELASRLRESEKRLTAAERDAAKANADRTRLLRGQGPVWIGLLLGFIIVPSVLCVLGLLLDVSLLPLLALPLVVCGLGGLLFPWKGLRSSLAAAILSCGLLGFVLLTMWLRPHPLGFSIPIMQDVLKADASRRMGAVDELVRAQDWQAARQEAESLEQLLRHAGGNQPTEMHSRALSLLSSTIWPRYYENQAAVVSQRFENGDLDDAYLLGREALSELAQRRTPELTNTAATLRSMMEKQVAPAWYAARVYWLDEGKLYSWDDAHKRVMPVFSAGAVSEFRPSPDGKRVAIRSGGSVYVVNRDGGCMVKLDYAVSAIFGWENASSLWLESLSRGDGVFSFNEQNSPQGFTRK